MGVDRWDADRDATVSSTTLAAQGPRGRAAAGVASDGITNRYTVDMRYVGQGHEITVALPDRSTSADGRLSRRAARTISPSSTASCSAAPSRHSPSRSSPGGCAPAGRKDQVTAQPRPSRRRCADALQGHAAGLFRRDSATSSTRPVYDHYTLPPSVAIKGPAIVEQRESTAVVGPSATAHVDAQRQPRDATFTEDARSCSTNTPDFNDPDHSAGDVESPDLHRRPGRQRARPHRLLADRAREPRLRDRAARRRAGRSRSAPGRSRCSSPRCRWRRRNISCRSFRPRRSSRATCSPTNDPEIGTGHLPDVTMITPIFQKGKVVAYAGSIAHLPDIGGRPLSPDATDIFEEGIRFPIVKLHKAGEPNQDVFDIIARQRAPADARCCGDLESMVAANEVMGRELLRFLDEYGLDEVDGSRRRHPHPLGSADAQGDPALAERHLHRRGDARRLRHRREAEVRRRGRATTPSMSTMPAPPTQVLHAHQRADATTATPTRSMR